MFLVAGPVDPAVVHLFLLKTFCWIWLCERCTLLESLLWRAVRFSGSAMVLRQKNSVLATKTVTLSAPSSKMQMPVRHSLFHESSLTQAVLADTPRNLSPTSQLKPTGPGNHSICQKQYQATSSWKPVIIANVYLCSTTECFNKSDSSSSTSSFQHSTQNSPMQASLWLPAWLFHHESRAKFLDCLLLSLSQTNLSLHQVHFSTCASQ